MGKQIAIAALFLALYGCGGNRYTVIGRTNDQGSPDWVKVVLAHEGQKIYANCNNLKAVAKGKTEGCKLYVGEDLRNCDFFPDPLSEDSRGYNLICGNELTNGRLDTTAGNELLQFEREEQTPTNYGTVLTQGISLASFLASVASLIIALSSLRIARSSLSTAEGSLSTAEGSLNVAKSSLRQAEHVAERERSDWRQQKWFDLYFKANEVYDALDRFQKQYSSTPATSWGTPEMTNAFNDLQFRIRQVHSMAVVFPKSPEIDELLKSTSGFQGINEIMLRDRIDKVLSAIEGLRQKALVDTSVLKQ